MGGSYSAPAAGVARRYCTQPNKVDEMFKPPTSFTKGWDSTGAGHRCRCMRRPADGSFWLPNCPSGYVPLSSVGLHIKNDKTVNYNNFKGFRCLNSAYAIKASLGGELWRDAGSRAHKDAMIKSIKDSPFWASWDTSKKWRQAYRIDPNKLDK